MTKFICTLFERASLPEGRAERRRAGFAFAISAALFLWAAIRLTLHTGSVLLDEFVSLSVPRTTAWYCAILGVGAGGAFYLSMAWFQGWTTRTHAAWLGAVTVGQAACVIILMADLVSDFAGVVAGSWSITVFSVMFTKGTQGVRCGTHGRHVCRNTVLC